LLKQLSVAGATNREGHRLPISNRAGRRRRSDQGRKNSCRWLCQLPLLKWESPYRKVQCRRAERGEESDKYQRWNRLRTSLRAG